MAEPLPPSDARPDPPLNADIELDAAEVHSLEALGRVYSQAISRRDKRPSNPQADEAQGDDPLESGPAARPDVATDLQGADGVPLTPRTIFEAMLFVGISQGNLSARRAASLIRGVSPREIEQLVDELNDSYAADGAAFRIQSGSDGYRLALEADLEPVRRQLHGRIREARLGHAAIEVLAVVAYHQPVTLDEIDRLRNRHSGPVLNLLVRRDLVSLERDPENRRIRRYRTTPRFLELFGMESIDDLPQAHSPQGADFLDD